MKSALLPGVMAVAVLLTGCSQSGDFSRFFVGEVTKYGGHAKAGAVIARLDAHWTLKRDRNGFTIIVYGQPYDAVDALMQQAFGATNVLVWSEPDGQPFHLYGPVDIGVVVQCVGRADGVQIICLKGPGVP